MQNNNKKEISQNKEDLWFFYPAEMPTIIRNVTLNKVQTIVWMCMQYVCVHVCTCAHEQQQFAE